MPKLVKGSQLPRAALAAVLASFGYRWTHENVHRAQVWHRAASGVGSLPTMPLQTDEQWLSEHAFYVTRNGFLAGGSWNRRARSASEATP